LLEGIIITLTSALLGGLIGTLSTIYAFKRNRKDDFINKMLIDSYECLESAFSRHYDKSELDRKNQDKWNLELQDAFARLQLLGPVHVAEKSKDYISS